MKVLILSVTAGQGHNSTGKALVSCFEKMGVECRFLDSFEYINRLLYKTVSEGYNFTTKVVPKPYSKVYSLLENRSKNADEMSAVRMLSSVLAVKLKKYINEYDPDAIICTHCFISAVLDVLVKKGDIRAKTFGVVTDFTIHPFWEECLHFDYIVTPNDLLNLQAFKKGFKRSQILPYGIPIDPKFASKSSNKAAVRRKLGLSEDKFTILLMSGSMGYGSIETVVKNLDDIPVDFQTIIVCGNNAAAKKKIDALDCKKRIMNLGYVNNVDLLMDASDCIISKPGGLTTSEALAKSLPMILVNPIPGQEDRNLEFLLNNGCAMAVTKTTPLEEVIYQFFYYTDRDENMKRSISLLRRPNSTKDLCDFIVKNCGRK